ncbi:nucleoside hydrolase [Thermobispora bispora]|uniref:Ribosylpyrimidine nucleosidase n=1 Tax=Thermobispora bispora (strain ATCC 19993 / DSM 43833 / CBS 139.67 / JCM 10125 / KCTC 9307 / NBRC 14880 / R51) TaxID=469371 RepID=D6Y594_THEBD|nr:nucleoside hydrolase [Thermobispora bispora]ADG89289.1 Ribosylpyrimidine nucleosidase [Thermobispora bispora DSM 43833]
MATPVILDCDPGHDDALAIMLAAADPAIDLKAITTVAGNQTLEKTSLNARRVCTLAGITGVPVAAGCDRPLAGALETAADVHGESGLDGPELGPPTVPLAGEHAVDLMHRILRESPEPVTIIAVGPLTNVATLLRRHPEDASRIRELVVMGGSIERGNHTPYAEFNVYVDPEAAAEVLASGLPVTLHGLNVTHQALVTPDVVDRFRGLGTRLGEVCAELMTFFGGTYRRLWGFEAPPLHDPVAVAYVIDRSVVECVRAPVRVELEGAYTRGATVVDLHRRMGWEPNADVGITLDRDRFWELMIAAVERLGGRA